MRGAVGVLLLALAACEGEAAQDEPPVSLPSPVAMAPREGPPGTEVTLEVGGLVMNARDVEIGFGDLTQHRIVATVDGDADGRVAATVAVPAGARSGTYYFFVAEPGGAPVVSDPFVVTAP